MRRCFVCKQPIPDTADCYRDNDKRTICVECYRKAVKK